MQIATTKKLVLIVRILVYTVAGFTQTNGICVTISHPGTAVFQVRYVSLHSAYHCKTFSTKLKPGNKIEVWRSGRGLGGGRPSVTSNRRFPLNNFSLN